MTSLTDIEQSAKHFADARTELATAVQELSSAVEALKRQHLARIKRLVNKAAEKQSVLRSQIEESPDLFRKPRTVIFHGIKLGYGKGKGAIEFEDPARVCELIRKHFSKGEAESLIHVKESPDKKALRDLSVAELKKIGCTVEETGDVIIIRASDSEVEKAVNALLADAINETVEEKAA